MPGGFAPYLLVQLAGGLSFLPNAGVGQGPGWKSVMVVADGLGAVRVNEVVSVEVQGSGPRRCVPLPSNHDWWTRCS